MVLPDKVSWFASMSFLFEYRNMTSGHKSTHLGGPHKISAFNKQIATTFLFISKVNLIIFLGKKKEHT
jgi:hypothetical protein